MNELKFILLGIFLSLSPPANAFDEWTEEDTYRQATIVALSLVDMSQTIYISKHPVYWENNPVLGNHPKQHQVYQYFIGTMALHGLFSYVLPAEYRKWWQYASIGFEGAVVARNVRIGVGFSF